MAMRRIFWPALAAALCVCPLAGATEVQNFFNSCKQDFRRNNAWPEPFIWPDRAAACAPFGVMIHNGWRMQNTLAAHHFREGTDELTEAGKLRVLWIVTEAPPQYRTIYIERADNAEITGGRIRNVSIAAQGLSMDGVAPPVMATGVAARGWPADQIDATTRRWYDTAPDPRLPDRSGGGGSSGGN
jgi:hypothetical protein